MLRCAARSMPRLQVRVSGLGMLEAALEALGCGSVVLCGAQPDWWVRRVGLFV